MSDKAIIANILSEIAEYLSYNKHHALFLDDWVWVTGVPHSGVCVTVQEDEIIINEVYQPSDMEIPHTGERLKTIKLANPNYLGQLLEFCDEENKKKQEETQNRD